ncbi:hypothetical protein EJ04DRAFT_533108 [Polyplosphaeria fusca]|uniref:endo-1,3(4)-beta-glucanase n=1 Tax=Polyplosphaeria fusca TaxID=682080 RepID=A0A9P4R5T7_9PLEO|nr:hypothetical protein EJ04DRAFT_533108 [Polyplosphaeria fusca]
MIMGLAFILLASLLSTAVLCSPTERASYSLVDNCTGSSSFFSCFDFFTSRDPTNGHVRYLSQSDAQAQGLISASENSVYVGVDYKNKAPNGRPSVRLQSKKLYNRGLFILDLAHMPASSCGSWPSFWSWGSETAWPGSGEIDIIEGVHTNTVNAMSLHTAEGCSISGTGLAGRVVTKDCYVHATGQTENAGCGIESASGSSFGTSLNSVSGGVYAMEWTASAIKIWFWPRASVPAALGKSNPNPSEWGLPDANFAGNCDFNRHFKDHRLVIDTTFCGDWAGVVWDSNPTCKNLAKSCQDFVANNPGQYAESYWRINSLKVYSQ